MFEIKPRDKMVERAMLVGSYTDPAEKAAVADVGSARSSVHIFKGCKSINGEFG